MLFCACMIPLYEVFFFAICLASALILVVRVFFGERWG